MAGRKKLPTTLKVIKGSFRKDRANKDEPKPDIEVPNPPDFLTDDALIEWKRMSIELENMGLISCIDMAALAGYCQAFGRWAQAERELKEQSLTELTSNGNKIQNPLVGIVNTAMLLMHRYITEFGLSPASRSKVTPKKKDDGKKNPFAGIGDGRK